MAVVTIVEHAQALAETAAARIAALIAQAIIDRHAATVCLTGGRTAKDVYERLGHADGQRVDWTRVHLFWGDERQVPPDDPQSNFGMAHRALLRHVAVPAAQIHRMRGELPNATDAAREYELTLRRYRGPQGSAPHVLFDVMLLSVGEDAHIASIFPGSPLLVGGGFTPRQAGREGPPHMEVTPMALQVAAVFAAHLDAWRITLTPPAILDARSILVMASGAAKATAVRAALELPEDVARWPVQLLRQAGDRVAWLIDREAAGGISLLRDP